MLIKHGSRGETVAMVQRMLNLIPDGIFGRLTKEAVTAFQTECGLKADGIIGPKTWAELISRVPMIPTQRRIDKIIVHCTATREGKLVTVQDIRSWHLRQGWADIGYHYVVGLDGTTHKGRDINLVGAHCSGQNTGSIGIVYVGGLAADGKTPKDTRTKEQKLELETLIFMLKSFYPKAQVYGHRDFAKKDCPCFDARKEYGAVGLMGLMGEMGIMGFIICN